jgi:predicted Rossmann fold flavoprotein
MARALGHSLVPTTPALAPLVLDRAAEGGMHGDIPGVALDVTLTLRTDGAVATRLSGALLWTHFGISGPVVLNMSRHWLRARLEGRSADLTASLVPGWEFQDADAFWLQESRSRPRARAGGTLSRLVPASMSTAMLTRLAIDPDLPLAALSRDDRRRLARAVAEWPLPVVDSRGYNYAEATAGGVDLAEVSPATMESRVCAGLFLVGEVLDVDGRLGGFNFQWAWSSAFAAARGLTKASREAAQGSASTRRSVR